MGVQTHARLLCRERRLDRSFPASLPCLQAAFLAVLAAALVAGAAASRHPMSTRSLLWGCGLDNYCCVDHNTFCLGGTVMKW